MENDDSDSHQRRRRRAARNESSSSESEGEYRAPTKSRARTNLLINSDSEEESSIETKQKRKRRPVIDDSDSSGSDIVRRKRSRQRIQQQPLTDTESSSDSDHQRQNSARIPTDDSYSSDWSVDSYKGGSPVKTKGSKDGGSSSDSDGQSDKCPICLLTFKNQEVGSPESCDHSFCVDCIQEWSKNVNTCPVDRQPFNLILVRTNYTGKVVRQVSVDVPNRNNVEEVIVDDPTYCEICGQCDREDRMLLCDGCDLGFHLECLTPPLQDVPTGVWYCADCGPEDVTQDRNIYIHEVELLINDIEDMERPTGPRRNTTRLVPRTLQSERLRARIITSRTQARNQAASMPGTSQRTQTRQPAKKKRRTKRRKRQPRIKITYEIDEQTGEEIVIKRRSYRKSKKKRKPKQMARRAAPPKTVKKRLAVQLGMCKQQQPGHILPDVRISTTNSSIGFQRSQAGIPTLHLFGNELDLFSGSDADNEGEGVGTTFLTRRRPNLSDLQIQRRANRKRVLMPTPATSCDVLGSILDSQEKFHSKDTVLSVSKDGTIKVGTNRNNNNNNRINLNEHNHTRIRQTTMYQTGNSSTSSPANSTQSTSHDYRSSVNTTSTTISNNSVTTTTRVQSRETEPEQHYSQVPTCSLELDKKAEEQSDSEVDLYSDIETVSTSKAEESDVKPSSPIKEVPLTMQSDDEANNSDIDLYIDTEKVEEECPPSETDKDAKEEPVTSTTNPLPETATSICDNQSKTDHEEDDDTEDECPNFSIYSTESINMAKNSDLGILNQTNEVGSSLDVVANPIEEEEHPIQEESIPDEVIPVKPLLRKESTNIGLYSDSDDEIIKHDILKPFGISDIRSLTEDISEEERSYTPCLDERPNVRQGIEGLDTEAISDEEKNDFDESTELKTASEAGDALEINAKDCELDFTKPEDYEEGEIIDRMRKIEEAKRSTSNTESNAAAEEPVAKLTEVVKESAFKKISKSNKERNYRDKEKDSRRSSSKDKNKENEKDRKRSRRKEKRKEIERYNVRTVVADKPRRMKDKFGRDARRRSVSRSSRSKSSSPGRRSPTQERDRSRKRRARSFSRSKSRSRKRSSSRGKRSLSRNRPKRRKSNFRQRKERNSPSPSPRRRRDWERRRSKGWTPSHSRSRSPGLTPSWTPPRTLQKTPVRPRNLTVILANDSTKKKKDKKKGEKKKKETPVVPEKQKKRKRDRTPPPSKEVFASGDNILVSVSFNKENDEREASMRRKSRTTESATKRIRKEKVTKSPRKKKSKDVSGIKPVAIIDLDRSPFREITPSPKDIIVLSDSEDADKNNACDSSQQADTYATGPKTPPEPQVKFILNAKPQMRVINNPLHEPDDIDGEIDPQEELEQRLNETLHKGPNTPPDPPNSPPSSPDAYDPFDPTKSRSPTPENLSQVQSSMAQSTENNESCETADKLSPEPQTPDDSHTPPLTDIQPADSQSNTNLNSTEINPNPIAVIINQVVQSQSSLFPKISSAPLVTSTPILTNQTPRINILNSTIIAPTTSASMQQRIVLPTTTKTSPTKVSPTKSTPIKQMPKNLNKTSKQRGKANDSNESNMELDSPYSPGPSDYEDLFEPPTETTVTSKPKSSHKPKTNKASNNAQTTFDNLFGSSPVYRPPKVNKPPVVEKKKRGAKTKMVGVKIDEDSLKILDDLPNSAVEMQVKDKFLKKLNRQERVVEEVKLVLKPHYNKKHISKDEYKDILRRAVPKICHNKSGEINPKKIQNLVEAYVKKVRHSKKVTSSSNINPLK